ncbi:MAG: glycosyltransferase [Candidatus Thermoplasmatota archaeon]
MSDESGETSEPVVGFLPCFFNMGESIPVVKIAEEYVDRGGSAVMFSHGGKYEELVEDLDVEMVQLNDIWGGVSKDSDEFFKEGNKLHKLVRTIYPPENIRRCVDEEVKAFRETNIDMIVCSFNLTVTISAKVVDIPQVAVVSGTAIPPYYQEWATFIDNFENAFTRLIPESLKNRFIRWFLRHNKLGVRLFNKVAPEYGVDKFRTYEDIYCGERSLVCDDLSYLDISPTEDFPEENFIGPIVYGDPSEFHPENVDDDVKAHIERDGKSIVVVMGSTGVKDIFLDIVDAFDNTDYNLIFAYTNLLSEGELPSVHDNILFKEFVSLADVCKMTDLAITHGGRGTVQTLAYSGKPAICIPMFIEHQYNVENMVRQGTTIKLSKKNFSTDDMVKAVEKIFNDYDDYLKNAERVAERLPDETGEKKGAGRVREIALENK